MNKIDKMIDWFQQRKGKVKYSMTNRTGPYSYDCSSSVYYAVCEALNLKPGYPKNTASLPGFLVQNGFKKITENSEWNAKRGDIVIWAKRKGVPGPDAHTGVFIDGSNIIHCNDTAKGISINSEGSLISLYNWNYEVYRLNENYDNDNKGDVEEVKDVSIRKLVVTDRAIDNLPHFCGDRNNVGNTVDFVGFVVTLTKKWENYYYSQYLNGFIHSSAFEDVITCNFKAKIKNKGYSVDNLPWTMRQNEWYKSITSSDELIGKEFTITAKTTKTGGYYYIHELAKWVDNRAFFKKNKGA